MFICYVPSWHQDKNYKLVYRDINQIFNWLILNEQELVLDLDSLILNGEIVSIKDIELLTKIISNKYSELDEGIFNI